MSRVFPGVEDVLQRFLLLTNALINDDLPTFDLPMKANSGRLSSGHCDTLSELRENSACLMVIVGLKTACYVPVIHFLGYVVNGNQYA